MCTKWAQHQRNNIIKQAETFRSEAIARQDRDTQELFFSMLNEVRNMKNNSYENEILVNESHPLQCVNKFNTCDNHELDAIKNVANNFITPGYMPPVPEKTTNSFVESLKEHHEFECHEFVGCCKLSWGKKLAMRHLRRMHLHQLTLDNSGKCKNCLDKIHPLCLSAKDLDKVIAEIASNDGKKKFHCCNVWTW